MSIDAQRERHVAFSMVAMIAKTIIRGRKNKGQAFKEKQHPIQ